MVKNHMRHSMKVIVLALFTVAAAPLSAVESTAQAFFDSGIEAYSQGNYEQALANYADALANGKDSSRLYYNMGLAHYQLDQYDPAEQAFNESIKDPELRALSYYNLGLVAKGRGNRSAAINHFERARLTARSDALRNNAIRALGILGVARYASDNQSAPDDDRRSVSTRQSELTWDFSARVGYDDNAFRSPSDPYVDLSQPLAPLVTPQEQSGMYIPLRIGASYVNPFSAKSSFVWSYDFKGDLYVDSELENANITKHRFAIGGERMVGDSGSANRRLAATAVLKRREQTNFDRDDGLDRFDDGQDISDRYNYTSVGGEIDLKNRVGKHRFTLGGGYERRDYDSVPTASEYDLDTYYVNGDIRFAVSADSRLKLGFEYYVRDYDQRRSRDALGNASTLNPTLEYEYEVYEVSFRHRFSDRFMAQLAYYRTERTDTFVGYNDYAQDKIRLTTRIKFTDRLSVNLRFTTRDQSYDNAFAFDDPTQPQKDYDEFEIYATTEYQLRDHLSIYGEVRFQDVDSSDPRGEYERLRAAIGVSWDY